MGVSARALESGVADLDRSRKYLLYEGLLAACLALRCSSYSWAAEFAEEETSRERDWRSLEVCESSCLFWAV